MSAVAAPSGASLSQHPLLRGAILPTLTRLALPNIAALVMAVLVAVAETYYVSRLGTTSLAAMTLVFPFFMLTNMMSNGAMGSGVSSAVSRALGAQDAERAATLARHAVLIGLSLGLAYSLLFLLAGDTFYGWLGGRGEVLAAASGYSAVLFSGAVLVWLCNTLVSVVRGTGNMNVPSLVVFAAAVVQIVVGGMFGLGLGPAPQWGMPGIALGNIVAMTVAIVVLLAYLRWGQDKLRVRWFAGRFSWPMFRDILRVGALACLSPLQTVLVAILLTGMVGRLGAEALAGYGIGQRLEFLLIPIAFGIGVAAVPMVGTAIGAGQYERARQVTWAAGWLTGATLSILGVAVLFWPRLWSGMFSTDPVVLAHADLYLRAVGPFFGFLGMGLALYFACMGAGYVLGPILAGTARMLLVVVGGAWLLGSGQATPAALFALIAAGMVLYGLCAIWAVRVAPWRVTVRHGQAVGAS